MRKKSVKTDKLTAEKERLKSALFTELLELYFEWRVGPNQANELPWQIILEDRLQPHTDILCEFSNWLLDRGWDRDAVEDAFFIVVNGDDE